MNGRSGKKSVWHLIKKISPAKIRQQLNLEVSARRVQQILKEYNNIQNIKRGAST